MYINNYIFFSKLRVIYFSLYNEKFWKNSKTQIFSLIVEGYPTLVTYYYEPIYSARHVLLPKLKAEFIYPDFLKWLTWFEVIQIER